MRRILPVLLALWACVVAQAATTYTASDLTRTEVANKAALLVAGDTLKLPTGTDTTTWTSAVTINVACTIIGSNGATLVDANKGTDATTTITSSGNHSLFIINPAVDGPVRITGIKLGNDAYKYGTVASTLVVKGSGYGTGSAYLTNVRVDHCSFNFGNAAMEITGRVEGVCYLCTFTNASPVAYIYGDDAAAWTRGYLPGTAHAFFIEDCQVTYNTSATTENTEMLYHQDAAASVFRYNTVTATSMTASFDLFDSHGNFGSSNATAIRGQPVLEFYHNTVAIKTAYRIFHIRGGLFISHHNTLTQTSSSTGYFGVTEEDYWLGQRSPAITTPPGVDQVQIWSWSDTNKGNATTYAHDITIEDSTPSSFFTEGTYTFFRAPTTGDKYHQMLENVDISLASYGSDGGYTYPHPLRGGPTLTSATVNSAGTSLTTVFSESTSTGSGGSGGMKLTINGSDVTGTYSSGSGSTTYVFTVAKVYQNATATVTYTQPTDGLEATSSGLDVATFNAQVVTNSSAQAIPAPTGPSATKTGQSTIDVNWTDGSSGVTSFIVYRSLTNGSFVQVGTTAAGVTVYHDSSLASGTQYYYTVASTAQGVTSSQTSSVNATTDPGVAPNFPVRRNPAVLGAGNF